jgi:hypothetical protein
MRPLFVLLFLIFITDLINSDPVHLVSHVYYDKSAKEAILKNQKDPVDVRAVVTGFVNEVNNLLAQANLKVVEKANGQNKEAEKITLLTNRTNDDSGIWSMLSDELGQQYLGYRRQDTSFTPLFKGTFFLVFSGSEGSKVIQPDSVCVEFKTRASIANVYEKDGDESPDRKVAEKQVIAVRMVRSTLLNFGIDDDCVNEVTVSKVPDCAKDYLKNNTDKMACLKDVYEKFRENEKEKETTPGSTSAGSKQILLISIAVVLVIGVAVMIGVVVWILRKPRIKATTQGDGPAGYTTIAGK